MQQENHLGSPADRSGEPLPDRDKQLRSRFELYRWLFWVAVFFIVVLLVAHCAHSR